jgi:hypothetical protein
VLIRDRSGAYEERDEGFHTYGLMTVASDRRDLASTGYAASAVARSAGIERAWLRPVTMA